MDKLLQSLFHFGSLVKGGPLGISPNLDDFELLQFMRPAPKEESKGFRVLLNVTFFEPSELQVDVVRGRFLEVRGTHGSKRNTDGHWMTRDLKYTFDIPEEFRGKKLQAEWSDDGYLLVQAKCGTEDAEGCGDTQDVIRLVPKRVPYSVRPVVEVGVLRDLIEDIRDKAQVALRYIRFYAREGTTESERQAEETIAEQLGGLEVKTRKSSEKDSGIVSCSSHQHVQQSNTSTNSSDT